MRSIQKLITLSLFGLLFSLANCKTDPDESLNPDPEPRIEPGFYYSDERPVGTPFEWPKGITLVGKVKSDFDCFDEAYKKNRHYGNGSLVYVCLNLLNSTNKPINVTLPPGIIWESESTQAQNGLLIKKVSIEVPAAEQYFALLHAYCVNPGRSGSIGYDYKAQPILTSHPGMEQLYRLVANKKINFEQYGRVRDSTIAMAGAQLGIAVHEISAGKPLSKLTRDWINAMPNE